MFSIDRNFKVLIVLFCFSFAGTIERVRKCEAPVFRPVQNFNEVEDLHGFGSIMQRCWSENPSDRPSFAEIAQMIKKLNTGKLVFWAKICLNGPQIEYF